MHTPNFNQFFNIEIEEHFLYHVSPYLFEFPDASFLLRDTKSHEKSALGLWASASPVSCQSFGNYVYEIGLRGKTNIVGWRIEHFRQFCSDNEIKSKLEYTKIRKYLIKNGFDVIYILDSTNCINEVIILNYDKINVFKIVEIFENKNIYIEVLGKFKVS